MEYLFLSYKFFHIIHVFDKQQNQIKIIFTIRDLDPSEHEGMCTRIDNTLYKDESRALIIRCRIHIYFISLADVRGRIILDNIVHIE